MARRRSTLAIVLLALALTGIVGLFWWQPSAQLPGTLDPSQPDTVTARALRSSLALHPDMPLAAAETDVLLVALCTMRRDRLGLYGHDQPTSPFLDQLAQAGVVFEQTFAQAPWTRPSMGALFTGRWPRALRLDNPGKKGTFDLRIDDQHTLLSEALGAHGYATIGAVANPNLKARFGFGQGFDHYSEPDATYKEGTHIPHGWEIVDDLLNFEEQLPSDQRLYARAVMLDPHHRPRPDAHYLPLFAGLEPRLQNYDAAVRTVDAQLARLITTMRKRRPNLLVIIAADHGEGLYTPRHHGPEHGNFLYRTSIQTPLIVQHPALPDGRRLTGPTMNIDVLPTVFDLLGLPLTHTVDGRSQAAAIRGQTDDTGHAMVFAETFFRKAHKATVFDGDHQLIRKWKGGKLHGDFTQRLFTQEDWRAETDLAEQEPAVLARLSTALDDWHAEQNALWDPTAERVEGEVEGGGESATGAAAVGVDKDTQRMLEELGYVE